MGHDDDFAVCTLAFLVGACLGFVVLALFTGAL